MQCPWYGHFTVRYAVPMVRSLYCKVHSVHGRVTLL